MQSFRNNGNGKWLKTWLRVHSDSDDILQYVNGTQLGVQEA